MGGHLYVLATALTLVHRVAVVLYVEYRGCLTVYSPTSAHSNLSSKTCIKKAFKSKIKPTHALVTVLFTQINTRFAAMSPKVEAR
jgi:hypothetical protein